MTLPELVDLYLKQAGGFGKPVPLSTFGLAKEDLERELSAYEEDYQISRFFQLTRLPDAPAYTINAFEYSHLAILPEIEEIL